MQSQIFIETFENAESEKSLFHSLNIIIPHLFLIFYILLHIARIVYFFTYLNFL